MKKEYDIENNLSRNTCVEQLNKQVAMHANTELSNDPFYSEDNIKRLSKAIEDANAGRNMSEHELI